MKNVLRRGVLLGLLSLAACTQPDQLPPPAMGASIGGTLVLPGALGDANRGRETADLPIITSTAPDSHTAVGPAVTPGELIVIFENGALTPQAFASPYPLRPLRRLAALGNAHLVRAEGLSASETAALARRLARQPGVRAAFPNWRLRTFATPNDEFYPFQWHYAAMNLEAAWTLETGQAQAVTVAVVDTGTVAHPDLLERTLPGYDFVSNPADAGDADARDADPTDLGRESGYHGVHVAGTVAAATNNAVGVSGVSWGAQVLPVRVLGVTGFGSTADVLDGIFWATGAAVPGVSTNPNPASVINLSLGEDIGQPCPAELSSYFQSLGDAGIIVVAAAGNAGVDAATTFPANCGGVLTVGATGPTGTRAPYSNFGAAVDLMAPGGDLSQTFTVAGQAYPAGVLSTVGDDATGGFAYAFYQGTSMAAPHVAGLVALLKAQNPALTQSEALTRLQGASSPLSTEACGRPVTDCGAGLIDAAAALGGSAAPPETPPTGSLTTYAAALACLNDRCREFDLARSRLLELAATANTLPYTVTGLEAGVYIAAAWQDLDGGGEVDAGEPFGVFPNPLRLAAGVQLSDVTIYLSALEPQRQTSSRRRAALDRAALGFGVLLGPP